MEMIEVKNLSKHFGNVKAVDDISFSVGKGEIVGFAGKNGAGKSTTIRCMLNMLFPTAGSITINSLDAQKDTKKIKGFLGYIPSDPAFYGNITCLELFRLCTYFSKNTLEKALSLAEFFELDANKKIGQLSLGNRKKVSIIAALLKSNKIIILDEPTSGLDPLMQEKFFDLMLKEKENGTTIFLSSHNLSEIEKYCDRVIIIKNGKIADNINMHKLKKEHKQTVSYTSFDGKEVSYEFDGDINDLVKVLSGIKLKTLEIKNVSIEDEFIKFYKGELENDKI